MAPAPSATARTPQVPYTYLPQGTMCMSMAGVLFMVPAITHMQSHFALPHMAIQQQHPPWHVPQQELQSLVTPHPQLESMSGCTAYLDHDETGRASETQAAPMTPLKRKPPWQEDLDPCPTKTRAIKDRDPPTSDVEIAVTPKGSVSKEVEPNKRTRDEDIFPPLTTPIWHATHSRPTQRTHFSRISSTPCPTPGMPHLA